MRFINYTMLCLLCCGLFALQSNAQSTTINLTPSQDNSLYEDERGSVSNGAGKNLYAVFTNQSKIRRALVQFDLSAIPSEATIESVQLDMTLTKGRGGVEDVSLHRTQQAWGEGTSDADAGGQGGEGALATLGDATWTHAIAPDMPWRNPGGDFEAEASAVSPVEETGTATWMSEDLMNDVQMWVRNPAMNFGWIVISNEERPRSSKHFSSREGQNPPSLSITYRVAVPENIDLELNLVTENPDFPTFKGQGVSLELVNNGNITATGVSVELPLPSGAVVVVGGTVAETSQGEYNPADGTWAIGTIAAGESVTLDVQLFPLSDGYVPYAQVMTADQEDLDSTPGNGECCFEVEDDEASLLGIAEPSCSFLDTIELPDDVCALCIDEIAVYNWEGALYYVELNGPINECSDGLTRVVDCEGVEICRDGGFVGATECLRLRFFETAEKVETLASCSLAQNIDLSLSVETDNPSIKQWQSGTFTLRLSNRVGRGLGAATDIAIALDLNADEVIRVGGSSVMASKGTYENGVWEGIDLAIGEEATLEIQLFSKVPTMSFYAQVTAATGVDVDSEPNNGTCCTAKEDDETSFTSQNGDLLISTTQSFSAALYPNPVQHTLHIQTKLAQVNYRILDLNGKLIRTGLVSGNTTVDMQDVSAGVYILQVAEETPMRFVKQ